MSFPPRPRMGMGPPHGMQHRQHFNGPPGYGPPGMMHHGHRNGMMPMMHPQRMMNQGPPRISMIPPSNGSPHFISSPTTVKKDYPVITVFIGNISERAPDDMIKLLLQRCGAIVSWKRVKGASGRLQAFGFCEYDFAISAMRCIRLLNELFIGEKKLLVKVDTKTQDILDDFMVKQKKDKSDTEMIEFNNKIKKEDTNVTTSIEAVLRENSVILTTPISKPAGKDSPSLDKEELKKHFTQSYKDGNKGNLIDKSLDELKLDKDEHNLITNEISFFRNSYKGESKESRECTPVKSRDHHDLTSKPDRDSSEPPRKERRHSRSKDHHESKSERRERPDKDRTDRDRHDKDRPDRERSDRERPDKDRSERTERDRSDRSERRHERRRSRDCGRRENNNSDDEEDVHERRRLERKMREKENAYQTILKRWETRERRKMREYEKDAEKDKVTKSETKEEAKRLREFLEDYNDVRDDTKFFKGHLLNRRLKDRETELLNDERDRKREKEEINELRNRLIQEGKPDCELELIRIEKETDVHLVKCLVIPTDSEPDEEPGPMIIPPQAPIEQKKKIKRTRTPSPIPTPQEEESSVIEMPEELMDNRMDIPDNIVIDNIKRKKLEVNDIFNNDNEDDTDSNGIKKRKLVPLDYNGVSVPADAASSVTTTTLPTMDAIQSQVDKPASDDKRYSVRGLIESIPTDKNDLFNFNIEWKMVDENLMERRIKPWINKKIVEYIGEEEPSLNEFICTKIMTNCKPQSILSDISMVLDDEAEVFVVKLWRLMIYESEAKRLGISKAN